MTAVVLRFGLGNVLSRTGFSVSDRFGLGRVLAALALVVLLVGCAGRAEQPADEAFPDFDGEADYEAEFDNDPLELLNRFTFNFNMMLDTVAIRPTAVTYRFLLPEEVRDSIRNFLRNLRTPVILANDLLQGELDRAGTTLTRFVINTTAGVLGLFDVADGMGYPHHDEDFGQTLAVHGLGEGAYLVLPILGPSSIRDAAGLVADSFLDPLTYVASNNDAEEALLARAAVSGIDLRSRNIETLDDLKRDAIDFYARIRSLYRQNRAHEIKNGVPTEGPAPGLYGQSFDPYLEAEQVGEGN